MEHHEVAVEVLGPWSLATSRAFWEGFSPATLIRQDDRSQLRSVFRVEGDWSRAELAVTQRGDIARIVVSGDGDLDAAADQARRFLSLDVDARDWPGVARRDRVIANAQRQLPGLRPCGFHSPYEAAAWAVLSQRIRIVQAARLRDDLVHRHGEAGAFPAPHLLRTLDLDLPGRKVDYLHAVADAALDGQLDGAALQALEPEQAVQAVRRINGLGPFGAELVVVAAPTPPTPCPSTSGGSTARSPSCTARTGHSGRSRKPGGPSAPGPPSCYAPSANNGPTRSAVPAAQLADGGIPAGAVNSSGPGVAPYRVRLCLAVVAARAPRPRARRSSRDQVGQGTHRTAVPRHRHRIAGRAPRGHVPAAAVADDHR